MNLVKKSLLLCIGALLVMLCLQAVQSLRTLDRLSTAADEIVAGGRLAEGAREVWSRFLDVEQTLKRLTAFVDAASAGEMRASFASGAAALRTDLAKLRAGAVGDLAEDARKVEIAVDAWLALAARHVSSEGVTELPSYHLLDAARTDVDAGVGVLIERSAAAATARVAAGHAAARSATWWTVGELAAAIGLGFVLGWRALRSLHGQLGADASEVAQVANAVADGDLTVHIAAEHLPAASVMAAIARMQQSLRQTVSSVLGISGTLTSGSNEIATGNHDLSRRTEQQARALERTATTLEQLGSTARHNADNSARASDIAERASTVAARGGIVVGQVVETMRGINDSSRKIVDIIAVIDAIAFQTNILALNAAVEAARAGEQGRGFAVVASEVRVLAKRSAEAAREIKALITASVERVEAGGTLVDQAGRTMHEVVQAIEQVTAVMTEIRTASGRQSSDVAQVGRSMAELDQATQQNAALAEESAAAAERVKAQGQQLVDAMTFFKVERLHAVLAEPEARPAPPRRPTPARATTSGKPSSKVHHPSAVATAEG